TFGDVQIYIQTKIILSQIRSARRTVPSASWRVTLGMGHEELPKISYIAGTQILLVGLDARNEFLFTSPTSVSLKNVPAGRYTLEHWENDVLQTRARVNFTQQLAE